MQTFTMRRSHTIKKTCTVRKKIRSDWPITDGVAHTIYSGRAVMLMRKAVFDQLPYTCDHKSGLEGRYRPFV